MSQYRLNQKILTGFFLRTALVIVLVSVLASVFFYYFELYNFKQDVSVNFRINAWDIFKHRRYLSTDSDIHDIQKYMDGRINVDKHIQRLAVHDENLKLMYETVRPGFPAEDFRELQGGNLPISMDMNNTRVEMINYNGATFLWMAAPVKNISGSKIGYIEALKKFDVRDMVGFRQRRLWAIAAADFLIILLAVALFPLFMHVYNQLKENERLLLVSNLYAAKSLGDAIALRDSNTSLHNFRVTLYAIALGEEIGISKEKMQSLIKGSFLHDIGKIGINDRILFKEGHLTQEEFEIIKTHVELGTAIVEKDPWFRDALDVIRHHHEKYAGSGYPDGIQHDDIPLNARIFAIIDVFDALTSRRPYKKAYKLEKASAILNEEAGTHFDENLLKVFLRIAPELYRDIAHLDKEVLEKLLREKVEYYFLY